jgi:hypothetical protein
MKNFLDESPIKTKGVWQFFTDAAAVAELHASLLPPGRRGGDHKKSRALLALDQKVVGMHGIEACYVTSDNPYWYAITSMGSSAGFESFLHFGLQDPTRRLRP